MHQLYRHLALLNTGLVKTWKKCSLSSMLFVEKGFAYSYKYFLLPSQKVPEAPGLSDQIWDPSRFRTVVYLYTFTAWNISGKYFVAPRGHQAPVCHPNSNN